MKSKSYLIKCYKIPRSLYTYFWKLTKRIPLPDKLSKDETKELRELYHHFIFHVYVSMRLKSIENDNHNKPIRIPIPCDLIWNKFNRKVNTDLFKGIGILGRTGYKLPKNGPGTGKCREYYLLGKVFREAVKIHNQHIEADWEKNIRTGETPKRVNGVTGHYMNQARINSASLYYNDRRYYDIPDLVKNTPDLFTPCPYNPHEILPFLELAKAKHERELKNFLSVKRYLGKLNTKEKWYRFKKARYQKLIAEGIYNNIRLCLDTILNQNPEISEIEGLEGEQLMEYKTAYRVLITGRFAEIHGGFH